MKIMALLASSRRDGNSEMLTNRVLQGIEHDEVFLLDHRMEPIWDQRHDEAGFSPVEDDYEPLLQKFLEQDIIVFAVPLYWFGMPGQLKVFFDRWSQYMRDERFNLKERLHGKKAYVIVTGSSPDPKIAGLPLVQQFGYLFDYMAMDFEDYVIGYGNKPGEIMDDPYALAKADLWNRELKQQNGQGI